MSKATICVVSVLVSFGLTTSASGQDVPRAESTVTARGLAMGTGARASATSSSAAAYNPAALALARLYHAEVSLGYSAGAGRWDLGGAIVDSSTNKLAAALSFRGLLGDGEQGYSGFDGRLSLGMALGEMLAIGVAGRYLSFTPDGQEGEDVEALADGLTFDASLVFSPTPGLRIVALSENILAVDSPLAPTRLGGGMSYTIADVFNLGADILVDVTTFEETHFLVGGGGEYFAAGSVPIRVGYVFDSGREIHTVTGGLGYVSQRFGIDVSLSQDVSGQSETQLMGAVRYFVH